MKYPIIELPRERFPPKLLEIPDPPKRLYVRGNLAPADSKLLAVVGARNYTDYGKEVCSKIIGGLRGYGISIISGLAMGIDAIAHQAALSARLYTLAIPGSGLDPKVLYPSINRRLAEKILDSGGGLLSEFDPNFQAAPWSFPQRNRIMAGISDAVLIIEAEKKSGTLITSRLGTEYNREVMAVPGSIFSRNSEGPHLLLRLGATPITSANDVLEAFHLKKEGILETENKLRLYVDCSPEEMKIIEILRSPISREDLLERLNLPISHANGLLSILELKDLIVESGGLIFLK